MSSKSFNGNRLTVKSGTIEQDASGGADIVNYRTLVGLPVREDRIRYYDASGLSDLEITPFFAERIRFYVPGGPLLNEENNSNGTITPNETYDEYTLTGPAFYYVRCRISGYPVDRTKQGYFRLTTFVITDPLNAATSIGSNEVAFFPNSDLAVEFNAVNSGVVYVPPAGGRLVNDAFTETKPLGGSQEFRISLVQLKVTKISA